MVTALREVQHARNPCLDASSLQVDIDSKSVIKNAATAALAFRRMGLSLGLTGTAPALVQQTDSAGFPVLYLPYETLVQNTSIWLTVAEFLGYPEEDATKYFQDRTVKRVQRSQKEIIANYDEVARDLKEQNLGYLLTG